MQDLPTSNPSSSLERLLKKHKHSFTIAEYIVRLVGVVTVSFIVLEILSFILVSTYNFATRGKYDNRMNIDVYKNDEWAPEYFREFKDVYTAEYYPYVGYKRPPHYVGDYINLDGDSVRKTLNPCLDSSDKPIRIFAFGGSTMWGTGARDQGTIPSRLSTVLCDKQYITEVINFGESGYVNSQDMIKLELELRKGNIPDIVIFYDGGNDVYSSYQNKVAGLPENIENRERDFNSRDELNINGLFPNFLKVVGAIAKTSKRKNIVVEPLENELDIETANIYLNNIRIVKSLESEFGFKSFFYWQPVIYTKHRLSDDERTHIDQEEAVADAYKTISHLVNESNDVTNLVGIFDKEKETIFIDWIHTSEKGNSIVANRIGEDLIRYMEAHELRGHSRE